MLCGILVPEIAGTPQGASHSVVAHLGSNARWEVQRRAKQHHLIDKCILGHIKFNVI